MEQYIRARTDDQKEERLNQIKTATEELFTQYPFQEITLTTIAQKLGWSRANLYKYVTTKEEIFLSISNDKMTKCYSELNTAFPDGNNFTPEVIAEVWTGIFNANQDYLRYVVYLNPIIETNVTVDRLADFKASYYKMTDILCPKLSKMLRISEESAYKLQLDILFYASTYVSSCYKNPLIQEALKKIGRQSPSMDFYTDLKDFILMKLLWIKK